MVNWDPGSGSAISDLEVEDREVVDTLYYVAYPLEDSGEAIVVATVRPETMLADTAVAVHPDDERYRAPDRQDRDPAARRARAADHRRRLRQARVRHRRAEDHARPRPERLRDRPPPRPPGDQRDRRGRPHDRRGRRALRGADGRRGAARRSSRRCEDEGRLVGREEYTHDVPFSHRSGERIEPLISLQWFMRMDELAQPAIEAVKDGRVQIHPERWTRVYLDWMEDIRPWCISRQLWWGHQLPVWYRRRRRPTSARRRPRARAGSATPTCSTPGSPRRCGRSRRSAGREETPELRAFYPTDVLSTARDILFLWVARMIMMGLEFAGDVPFDDVYIHSVIQAPDGRRMSKSLGTGIDPLDEIEKHGADAVRFGLLAMSSTQDVRYSAEKVAAGPSSSPTSSATPRASSSRASTRTPRRRRGRATIEDRWILSRLAAPRARRSTQHDRGVRLLARRARRSTTSSTASCATGTSSWSSRACTSEGEERADLDATLLHVLHRDARARAPGDPVRDRGDLVARARRRGPAGGAAAPRRRATGAGATREAERALADAIEAVQALRGWRDGVGAPPARGIPARLEADGYDETADARRAAGAPRAGEARTARPSRRDDRDPRRRGASCTPATRSTSARPSASRASGARARGRDRPLRGQARQRGLRRQGAARGRRRPSATSSRALRAELEAWL